GVLPDVVFRLMTLGAFLDAGVRRGRAEEAERRSRCLDLLGGLALLVRELSVGAGNLVGGRRIIGHGIIERNIAVDLFVDLALACDVNPELAQIFGLAIGVGQGSAVEMLDLCNIAELAGANNCVNLGVLSSERLSLVLRHIGQSENE